MVPANSEFEFDFSHRAGIKLQAADEHSRLTTDGEDKTELNDAMPVPMIGAAGIAKEA